MMSTDGDLQKERKKERKKDRDFVCILVSVFEETESKKTRISFLERRIVKGDSRVTNERTMRRKDEMME